MLNKESNKITDRLIKLSKTHIDFAGAMSKTIKEISMFNAKGSNVNDNVDSLRYSLTADITKVYEVIEDITELLEEKYNYVLKIDDIEDGKIVIDLVDFIEIKRKVKKHE